MAKSNAPRFTDPCLSGTEMEELADDLAKMFRKSNQMDLFQLIRAQNYTAIAALGLKITPKRIDLTDQLADLVDQARKPHKSDIVFAVINSNSKLFGKLLDAMDRFKKRKWVTRSKLMYSFEKYTESGEHYHINLLIVDHGQYPSEIRRELITCFGHLYDNTASLNLAFRTSEGPHLENFKKYIAGDKKEEKMHLVLKDKKWRLALGLPDYFLQDMEYMASTPPPGAEADVEEDGCGNNVGAEDATSTAEHPGGGIRQPPPDDEQSVADSEIDEEFEDDDGPSDNDQY
jgi:hypothetical protein